MSTNLESARAAIEAEIAHAKQGIAHFSARIEALEKTLSHILSLDGGVSAAKRKAAAPVVKRAKAPKAAKPGRKAKVVKAAKSTKGGKDLPFTGGDYWFSLVTEQPQSGAEILQKAISKLGFTPSKEQIRKLSLRQTFALNAMVMAKKIKDSGTGRARRFFRA